MERRGEDMYCATWDGERDCQVLPIDEKQRMPGLKMLMAQIQCSADPKGGGRVSSLGAFCVQTARLELYLN